MISFEKKITTGTLTLTGNINDPEIIEFLMNSNQAEIYHLPAWIKSLCDSYGGDPYYVLCNNNETGKIEGIAPFILFNGKSATKKKIISLPFTNYCDFILPAHIKTENILEIINSRFGSILEFDFRNLSEEPLTGFSNTTDFLVHVINLKPTLDETYNSFGKRSIRRFIRKADENGLTFRLGESDDDFRIFYDLEVKLRKSIGLPPAPYKFFYSIWSNLRKQNLIYLPIVSFKDEPVAASMVLHFKDRIYFEYTGLSKKYKNLYGNHKLHWDMIKIAQGELGVKYVELGRVSVEHKDLIFFKENWGAVPYKVFHKRFPSQTEKNFVARIDKITYPLIKEINKKLPRLLLELEGRAIYRYLKILLICGLFLK